ncbi:hypothetical protein scyTo_0020475 [Scyliorhinus torazame]|uniref:Uncharacterized protein n=1 Tax=Scyliorhinus torazame TaxID=75743 RepID=A0A401PTL0_SCYTO|nr:hypothetical protein [Scyliorhinus torazame]
MGAQLTRAQTLSWSLLCHWFSVTYMSFCHCRRSCDQDYQTDSGMVLTSEELDRPTWMESKPRHSQSFGLKSASKMKEPVLFETANPTSTNGTAYHFGAEGNQMPEHESLDLLNSFEAKMNCCTPPPDYNSLTFYTSPPV